MPERTPKEIEDAIIAAYLSGATAKQAAAQFGYSEANCLNILRRRDIKARSISELHRIPPEHEDAIIEAYLNGASQKEAAALFGYGVETCLRILRQRGVELRKPETLAALPQARRIPREHEDAMIAAYLSGATVKEAAALFGYSDVSCSNVLRRRGIKARTISEARMMPREHEDAIIAAYVNGATMEQAAALFGYTHATCINVLKRRGITKRTLSEALRRYAVDESFFDFIDTEDKAYWLGFLTSDGLITDSAVRINLQVRDVDHLHKFTASLQSEHSVTFRDNVSSNGVITKQAVIIISSLRLVRALNRLGLTPNKTFTVRPCEYVPEELLAAYWRGVFDGDGSISRSGPLKAFWQLSLVGNKAMVEGFRAFIACFVNTNATVRPVGNVFRIGYTGRPMPRAIAQILYENATIYLDRKYALARELCGRDL